MLIARHRGKKRNPAPNPWNKPKNTVPFPALTLMRQPSPSYRKPWGATLSFSHYCHPIAFWIFLYSFNFILFHKTVLFTPLVDVMSGMRIRSSTGCFPKTSWPKPVRKESSRTRDTSGRGVASWYCSQLTGKPLPRSHCHHRGCGKNLPQIPLNERTGC